MRAPLSWLREFVEIPKNLSAEDIAQGLVRVGFEVEEIIEQGKAKDITIEAISINAGFVSRSKFIDAFKERKGVTPSAYIKRLAENA